MRKINPAFLNIGIYLVVPLILGVAIGYQVDKRLGTGPIGMLIFILLGAVSTFYNLWKLIKEIENDKKH